MTAYLPNGWLGKGVVVLFRPEGSLKGHLYSWSEGGVFLYVIKADRTRKLFIAGASILYIEMLELKMLEQADEGEAT